MVAQPSIHSLQHFEDEQVSTMQQKNGGFALQAYHETPQRDEIACTIENWLLQNYPPTAHEATPVIYRKILTSLRAYLRARDLDLDSPAHQLRSQIATWATLRTPGSKRQGSVAPATYNQRIAAVNGFYTWAGTHNHATWSNPTEELSRNSIRKYAGSKALDIHQIRGKLQQIDRNTPRGQRDYTLLQIALNTGRSSRELASLTLGSLLFQGQNIILAFTGGRGGKILYDTLDIRLSQILLDYLRTIYSEYLEDLDTEMPVWVSFSDRTYGQAIGPQTIADICETHLGVTRIQKLRHTFAFTMDQLGAPLDLIQTRLGHESRVTTSAYLASLKQATNPYAARLGDAFGL